ncbi:spore germination protein XA [Clostridium homopropionicum DSM 5847]|uniref:Spore germination protein XA n=1 Tax=Clostridium homopropionicum DSM 5847 TaxID=1121318 RepID=A0A0L6Z785_9CLOT|nr:spore germination protein [Clostridium homopropionicum]KOA18825.1 spore germination protein XA [Clostridium homopropionicum DSM 5847]SFG89677.1 spore germination protein KA [Clostridium homopropionicum]
MSNKNTDKIQEIINNISGVLLRKLQVTNKEVWIAFIPQISDRDSISNNIIRPLLCYDKTEELTLDLILNSVIYIDDVFEENDENNIVNHVLEGKAIIILTDSDKFIVANTISIEKRAIESPQIETNIRSPRDAFTENLDSNLSLIRHRIKDQSLKIDYITVGSRTKTDVVVIYLSDITNKEYVKVIKKRIKDIKIDGILESAYVQKFISNKDTTFLPQMGIYEKSDSTCANILEGKICIMVDGSNIAIITPKNFVEFFDASDDHYENMYISFFIKMLRFEAFIITLTLSAIYVGIVAYHADIIPAQYIIVLAASRTTVPVNAITETILMEMVVELLREASARLPKQIGPAIGIVGTIVIGQAAVVAGLVSPLMVIIVALGLMASFAIPDYTIMNSIRLMKFGMILITGLLGIFGFIMGITFIVIKLASISTLGVPYLAPIAPFYYENLKNYFLSNIVHTKKRPEYLKNKDDTRQ